MDEEDRGRTFYFGVDADETLRKYLDQRNDLQAGRTPRVQGEGLTVRDLCNRFWAHPTTRLVRQLIDNRTGSIYVRL